MIKLARIYHIESWIPSLVEDPQLVKAPFV